MARKITEGVQVIQGWICHAKEGYRFFEAARKIPLVYVKLVNIKLYKGVLMRFLILSLMLLGGCIKPVSPGEMILCSKACFPKMLKQACNHSVKGLGCLCSNDEEIWLDDEERALLKVRK